MMRFNVGSATVTVFNTGDLRADLADWFGVRAEDWPQYASVLAQPARVPMNAVHIALGEASVLVDAPRWHESIGTEFLLPGYTPPQDLPEQMRAAGIAPDAVTHVVITHAHFDHFSGLLDKTGTSPFQTRGTTSAGPIGTPNCAMPTAKPAPSLRRSTRTMRSCVLAAIWCWPTASPCWLRRARRRATKLCACSRVANRCM